MDALLMCVEVLTAVPVPVLMTATICLLTLYYWPVWERHKYPPGPWPLPFIGHKMLYAGSKNPMAIIKKWNLSEVCTLQLFEPTVFLNSPEAIIEGFIKNADAMSERPQTFISPVRALTEAKEGGLIDEFRLWKDLRSHAIGLLKEQGVGKSQMEVEIAEECSYFMAALEKRSDEYFDVKPQLTQSISNVISRVLFNKRYSYSSEQLSCLQFVEFLHAQTVDTMIPLLKYIPFDPIGYYSKMAQFQRGLQLCRDEIAAHKLSLEPENPRDYIDSFLIEMNKTTTADSAFTEAQLLATVLQMFIAGTDTTSTALHWAFLYMILYPDIQLKVQTELDDVIGDRKPVYADRSVLHYTHAVVSEVLRMCIAPVSLFHTCDRDIVVRGYKIPKGATVVANIWCTCNDERTFSKPECFSPDHFLDDRGQYRKPDKMFMPFSAGRRACLGEVLARTELFVFFATTLQKYSLRACPSEQPSAEGMIQFVNGPRPYKLLFTPRHSAPN